LHWYSHENTSHSNARSPTDAFSAAFCGKSPYGYDKSRPLLRVTPKFFLCGAQA